MENFPLLEPMHSDEKMKSYELRLVDLFCSLRRDNGDYVELVFDEIASSTIKDNTIILFILYKIIGYTRDTLCGKGERDLAYRMIWVLYKHVPDLAIAMLHLMVRGIIPDSDAIYKTTIENHVPVHYSEYSFGCWKDVKYFCDFVYKRTRDPDHRLIAICMTLLNQELYDDFCNNTASLACKWVPREGSRFSWLFEKMALQWIAKVSPRVAKYSSKKKCFMMFRKVLSILNRVIGINEVNMCDNTWGKIDPRVVSRDQFIRNKNAILNMDRQLGNRYIDRTDRRNCAHTFRESFIDPGFSHNSSPSNIACGDFVKWAAYLLECKNSNNDTTCMQNILYQITLINRQWANLVRRLPEIANVLPLVNMALDGDELYGAIGNALLIASKSKLGKRIMAADNTPTWVNLESCANFIDEVGVILYNTNRGTRCNLGPAVDIIQYAFENDPVGCQSPTILFCMGMYDTVICNSFRMMYWNHFGDILDNNLYVSGDPFDILRIVTTDLQIDSFETMGRLLENVRYKIIDTMFDKYSPLGKQV